MRMLFTGLPLKLHEVGCCSPYVAVSAVKVFWRWQAFPCRECLEGFLHGTITSENRSLWGKGMDEHQDDDDVEN